MHFFRLTTQIFSSCTHIPSSSFKQSSFLCFAKPTVAVSGAKVTQKKIFDFCLQNNENSRKNMFDRNLTLFSHFSVRHQKKTKMELLNQCQKIDILETPEKSSFSSPFEKFYALSNVHINYKFRRKSTIYYCKAHNFSLLWQSLFCAINLLLE